MPLSDVEAIAPLLAANPAAAEMVAPDDQRLTGEDIGWPALAIRTFEPLTPEELETVRLWISGGAKFEQATADRQSATREWSADLGEELKNRAGMKIRARQRSDAADRMAARGQGEAP